MTIGYAFLLFKSESSIHKLLLSCKSEGDKHFIYMPTSNLTKKKVYLLVFSVYVKKVEMHCRYSWRITIT